MRFSSVDMNGVQNLTEKAKYMFFRLGMKPKLPGIVIQQFFIYGPLRDLFQVNFMLGRPAKSYFT